MDIKLGIAGLKDDTNIAEIEVPKELEREEPTGIPFFDDCMGGNGMTPSTVMLLTGTPGTGKSTLCIQLADSVTRMGSIALFNTGEESLYQTKKVYRRLGLRHGFYVGQDRQVPEVIAHSQRLHRANGGKKQLFVFLDSLETLDDGYYKDGFTNSRTKIRVLEQLCSWAKAGEAEGGIFPIIVVIGQVTKNGEFAGPMKVKHAIDVHAHMYIEGSEKSAYYKQRLFEVTKNRYGPAGFGYTLELDERGIREQSPVFNK